MAIKVNLFLLSGQLFKFYEYGNVHAMSYVCHHQISNNNYFSYQILVL